MASQKKSQSKKHGELDKGGWPKLDIGVPETAGYMQLTDDGLEFVKAQLKRHNKYRKAHGAPKLKISAKLTRVAKEWAAKLAREGSLRHRQGSGYGENIFMKWGSGGFEGDGGNPGEACDNWYKEIAHYRNWNSGGFSANTGHFTQVVWIGSQFLGVAKATVNGRQVVVANYYPAGNMMGAFQQNVRPPMMQISAVSSSESEDSSDSDGDNSDADEGGEDLGKKQPSPGETKGAEKKPKKKANRDAWPDDDIASETGTRHVQLISGDLEFCRAQLKRHNKYRKAHGVPKLKISKKLSQYAKDWAQRLATEGCMRHRSERKFGENIFMKWGSGGQSAGDPGEACDNWYSEISQYRNWNSGGFSMNTGHFSQVVWASSKYVGVARAVNSSGMEFVVANYDPHGNMMGQFPQNVRPPIKQISAVSSSSSESGDSGDESEPEADRKEAKTDGKSKKDPKDAPAKSDPKTERNKSDGKVNKHKRASALDEAGWPKEDMSVQETASSRINLTASDLEFMKAQLRVHNKYRKAHGAPKLKMSAKLTRVAKEWAMRLAQEGSMKHRQGSKYGENIFMKWGSGPQSDDPKEACDSWYSEIAKYRNWDSGGFSMHTGHFTQVVWVGSEFLGVARAITGNGMQFVVANYYPPGNMMGAFPQNVRPPLKALDSVSSSSSESRELLPTTTTHNLSYGIAYLPPAVMRYATCC